MTGNTRLCGSVLIAGTLQIACASALERPVQRAEDAVTRRVEQLESVVARQRASLVADIDRRLSTALAEVDRQRTAAVADVDRRIDRQRRETLSAVSAQRLEFQGWAEAQRSQTLDWAALQREHVQAWATEQREALESFVAGELSRVPQLARESSTGATTGVLSSIGLRRRPDGTWDVTTFLLLLGAIGGGFSIVKSAWRRATGRAFVREQKTSNVALPPAGTVFAHAPVVATQPQPAAPAAPAGETP